MKIDRLFNVLVLGGAAIAATACTATITNERDGAPEAESDANVPERDAAMDASNAGDAVADAAPDAPSDAVVGEGGCHKTCSELGVPCCWMGDCTTDPMCAMQLCK